ncbi:MAG TPA: class I SAM-dependent methyltransferase [Planctomycetia bacterium]|nr:class I SAM-dependent methyltransferase [Planctomycetia bacterium]
MRGATHAERMDGFYRGQAKHYDDFRKRLLHGREEMYAALPTPADGVWVEFGGGTGSNLENLGGRIGGLGKVYIVDLAKSLLDVAAERAKERGWSNVVPVAADATEFAPPEGSIDVATFSYSLTMIPDWFAAIDQAWRLLKPGGTIGVVDFYVSRKHPAAGRARHGWFNRTLWPTWFGTDNVHPSADHVPYLFRKFEPVAFREGKGKVPYLPLLRAPYYLFVGRKPTEA